MISFFRTTHLLAIFFIPLLCLSSGKVEAQTARQKQKAKIARKVYQQIARVARDARK